MRLIFLSIFIFCFQYLSFTQNNIDVLDYKFNIGLNDVNDTIHGVAIINFEVREKTKAITLDLASINTTGKGMKVTGVGSNDPGKQTIAFSHSNNKLVVTGHDYSKGDKQTFIVTYKGVPADGLIISKTKYGHRGFFADNWPDRGHNWIPCHEDPADKATVEFIITAPEHYQVVANGVQLEETSLGNGFKLTHWKEETPVSTKVMVIGVADFAVNLAGFVNGCIPIYSWVYPENKEKGFYDYAIAKDILPFFINNVGPYGYKKLANVQSRTRFGGLENANTIFYSEGTVTGTRRSEGTITHEIAHQWFGNMATEKSFGHLWLSEGFATYFTILYFEKTYGKDTAMQMLKEDREQVIAYSKQSNKSIVDTAEKDYMKLLNVNSYQKGGWVLHMLHSELGDSVFWRSIRKYYAKYAGSIAGTEDLQKVFEEVSGNNLSDFFKQWLYESGQPDLSIQWNYNSQSKEVTINIEQKQTGDFTFPLDISLTYLSGKSVKQKFFIDKRSKIFTVKVPEKPVSLIADPDVELLMNCTLKEK